MKHNMSFKDRTFRVLLAMIAVITYENTTLSLPMGISLLTGAVFLVVTAAIDFCPVYFALGIRRWESQEPKFNRMNGKGGYHHYYHVNVSWNHGRQGVMCSPELNRADGAGSIEVATPPQFPKGVAGIWSPEHLFTAAVSSCMMTTFLAVAEKEKLKFKSFSCPSEGRLERKDGSWMMTEVTLHPTVMVADEDSRKLGERVVDESLSACLISNSIRSRIISKPVISVEGQI